MIFYKFKKTALLIFILFVSLQCTKNSRLNANNHKFQNKKNKKEWKKFLPPSMLSNKKSLYPQIKSSISINEKIKFSNQIKDIFNITCRKGEIPESQFTYDNKKDIYIPNNNFWKEFVGIELNTYQFAHIYWNKEYEKFEKIKRENNKFYKLKKPWKCNNCGHNNKFGDKFREPNVCLECNIQGEINMNIYKKEYLEINKEKINKRKKNKKYIFSPEVGVSLAEKKKELEEMRKNNKKWICNHCSFENKSKHNKCKICKKLKDTNPDFWKCRKCTYHNLVNDKNCSICKESKNKQNSDQYYGIIKNIKDFNSFNPKNSDDINYVIMEEEVDNFVILEEEPKWNCPCGNKNKEDSNYCTKCGNSKIKDNKIVDDFVILEPKWNCSCGNKNKEEFKFCTDCGTSQNDLNKDIIKKDHKWNCSCGNINNKEFKFCTECANWNCTCCGNINKREFKFCTDCGTSQNDLKPKCNPIIKKHNVSNYCSCLNNNSIFDFCINCGKEKFYKQQPKEIKIKQN